MRRRNLGIVFLAGGALAIGIMGSRSHAESGLKRMAAQVIPTNASVRTGNVFARPGKLDVGDVVRVSLLGLFGDGNHDSSQIDSFELHVADDGMLNIPLVGPVQVKGLTTDRAAAVIVAQEAKLNISDNGIVVLGIVRTLAETHVKPGGIAIGDNLRVTIFDVTGPGNRLEILAQVADDGTITLPVVGPVKIVGVTEAGADDAVVKAIVQKGILQNPTVSVLRLDPNGLP